MVDMVDEEEIWKQNVQVAMVGMIEGITVV
jgi:hypothetical protein